MIEVVAELAGYDMRRFVSVEALWCGDGGCIALPVGYDAEGRALMCLTLRQISGVIRGEARLRMRFVDNRGRVRSAAVCGCFDYS